MGFSEASFPLGTGTEKARVMEPQLLKGLENERIAKI